jgi:undecaprenyl pyrophosphate phosphatase UppP
MTAQQHVEIDERAVAVANASYRWGFTFIIFALLLDVMYRGAVRKEAAWDLLALVIAGSGICTAYQVRKKILGRRLWKWILIGTVVAFVVSLVTAAILTLTKAM